MRVVAGTARGRTIDAPPGTATRPTSDRVREAIFNALGSLDAVDGATVLDLFAGSGAMGIEALSRGARSVVFVESDRGAPAMEAQPRTVWLHRPGRSWCRDDVSSGTWTAAARRLTWRSPIRRTPSTVGRTAGRARRRHGRHRVRSCRRSPIGWDVVRERTYGSTVVQIATRVEPRRPPVSPQEQMQ